MSTDNSTPAPDPANSEAAPAKAAPVQRAATAQDRQRPGGQRRGRGRQSESGEPSRGEYVDKVVKIRRCACVVKGGRRFSFAALVVVGDRKGRVGYGYGKANEVPPSVEKATKQATRAMLEVPLVNGSIPHVVEGRFGTAKVRLIPAGPGTGVIAGSAVRAVCEALGVTDILTKAYGTNNPMVVVKATMNALKQLRTRQEIERLRGVSLS